MSVKGLNIAVLVSGGGSNLQKLIEAQESKYFESEIKLVLSNKSDAYALKRAEDAGIKSVVLSDECALIDILEENSIDLVVLAGYLKIIDDDVISRYKGRIINIHPSLLPKYGGKGMYGLNVHRAVYEAKEKESGATVHQVTNVIDGGEIIIQKSIYVGDAESPEEIQKMVLNIEHEILKQAVKLIEEV